MKKNITLKKSATFLIILLVIILSFGGCGKKKARQEKLTQNISEEEGAVFQKDGLIFGTEKRVDREEITKIFEKDFSMAGLIDHKVYIKDKIIETDFYFDKNTTRDAVRSSISFAEVFLDNERGPFADERLPYADISKFEYYDTIYSRVFYEDVLIYQQTLNKKEEGKEKLIFEEANIFLPFREVKENKDLMEFREIIMDSMNASDVTFERAIMHHVLIINIKTKNIASSSNINQIKRGLDMDLAGRLVYDGFKLYNGYLLGFRMGTKMYHEEFYVDTNSEQKWYSVKDKDWMNHNYIFFE